MREKLQLKQEEQLILLSADINPDKSILNRIDEIIPTIIDWDYFTKLAINSAAAPLIVDKISRLRNAGLFPETIKCKLKQASLKTLGRNMLLIEHFRQVIRAFNEAQIPVIALKGSMLSEWLYGNINLRQFSDIDLLVPEKNGPLALVILERMGYSASKWKMSDFISEHTKIVHYTPMIRNGVCIEIHIRLHYISEAYQVDLNAIWQRAVPLQLHGVPVLGLCPEDLLMHLCIHLDKHVHSGQFQFTCLYDIVNMLNHKGDVLNWTFFEQLCLQANAVSVTYKYLLLAQKYMNGQLPISVSEKYSHTFEPKVEQIFLAVLRGNSIQNYASSVYRNVSGLDSFSNRIHYLFDLFFPKWDFMKKRYRLKRKRQLWTYYPYRHLMAFMHIWLNIKKAFY